MNFKAMIILLFFFLLIAKTQAQSAPTVVSIDNFSSAHGATVTAPIFITNVENYGTGTMSITYDPVVVHALAVSSGPDSIAFGNIDNTIGIVKISAWNIAGVSGNIIFANITFKAVGSAGNSTPLKLLNITLLNTSKKDIPKSVNDGYFYIEDDANSSTPTPTPIQTSTPTSTPTLSPSPSPSPADSTDGGSSVSFETNSKPSSSPTSINTPPAPAPTSLASFAPSPTFSPAIPLLPSETAEAKANVTPASTSGSVTPRGKVVPGFETTFACTTLLIAYLLLFRKGKKYSRSIFRMRGRR